MANSTLFILGAVAVVAWLGITILVASACRIAGRSDEEIAAFPERPNSPQVVPLRAHAARPRAARFAARS
jgi:hypothetical protein